MFLTADEIRELTGYTRLQAQLRWLDRHAFPYVLGGDGVPKLLRSYVVLRLGCDPAKQEKPRPQVCSPWAEGASSQEEKPRPQLRLPVDQRRQQ